MWINLPKELLEAVAHVLDSKTPDGKDPVAAEIRETIERAYNPDNGAFIQQAKDEYQQDGEVEIDEQGDGSAMISHNDEGGAYVMAWVYIRTEPEEDDDE